jgi:hypothetical protein
MATDTTHAIRAQHRFEARSSEQFDRAQYTMSLLRLLKPRMTVAVYSGGRYLQVERSRRRSSPEPWAILSIPRHATREIIAAAVVELSELQGASFLVDLLCTGPQGPQPAQ